MEGNLPGFHPFGDFGHPRALTTASPPALWLVGEASSITEPTAPEPETVFDAPEPNPPPVAPRPSRPWLTALPVALSLAAGLALWWPKNDVSDPVTVAWETLDGNPKDPEANGIVGRDYALRGDWASALPHLEASKRSDYRAPARLERQARAEVPLDMGQLLAVSRAWWKLANAFRPGSRDQRAVATHAAAVYLKIVDQLVDLGEIEDANKWLDRDAEFRRLVRNKRPQRAAPRVQK